MHIGFQCDSTLTAVLSVEICAGCSETTKSFTIHTFTEMLLDMNTWATKYHQHRDRIEHFGDRWRRRVRGPQCLSFRHSLAPFGLHKPFGLHPSSAPFGHRFERNSGFVCIL